MAIVKTTGGTVKSTGAGVQKSSGTGSVITDRSGLTQMTGSQLAADRGSTAAGKTGGGGTATYIAPDGSAKTGVYDSGLGRPDYSTLIQQGVQSGASWQEIQDWQNTRNALIAGDASLAQYAGDLTDQLATSYINQKRADERSAAVEASYQDQFQQMQDSYAAILAQQEAAKRAAVEQGVNQLSGQKEGINQSYADLQRQLYIDQMNAKKNLPQQMAAMGYTGGLTESAALGLENSYADALRQGEQQRISTLSDIDRAIADAYLTGDISIAEQAAQLAQNQYSSYAELLAQMRDQSNWERQMGLSERQAADSTDYNNRYLAYLQSGQDLDAQSLQYQKDLEAAAMLASFGNYSGYARLWGLSEEAAQAMAEQYHLDQAKNEAADKGAIGDLSGYGALGWDTSYLKAMQDYELQSAALNLSNQRSSGGSGSSGASGDTGSGEYSDYDGLFLAAMDSGNPNSFIANNYKKYGISNSSGLTTDYKSWLESPDGGEEFRILVSYTKKCIEKAGRSPEYMYDALRKQGYSEAVIDRVYSVLGL